MGLARCKCHDRVDEYLEIHVCMSGLADISCEMSTSGVADKTDLLISSPQSLVLQGQVERRIGILERTVPEQALVRKGEVVHDKGDVRAAEVLDHAGDTARMMYSIAASRIENHTLAVFLVGIIYFQIALLGRLYCHATVFIHLIFRTESAGSKNLSCGNGVGLGCGFIELDIIGIDGLE